MCQSEICLGKKKIKKQNKTCRQRAKKKLFLKFSGEFSKQLLALLCHQLEELFIPARLKNMLTICSILFQRRHSCLMYLC